MPLNRGYDYQERVGYRASGRTVTEYLAGRYDHSDLPTWTDRVQRGEVLVDGAAVDADQVLRAGQSLVWRRPPWEEPGAPLDFGVLFIDEHLLAVAKPAGLPSEPGGGFLEHTLLHCVRARHPEAVPLHRLGRWTSGLVLCARTTRARSKLAGAWRDGRVEKRYRALAAGSPARDEFAVDVPIGPVPHPLLGTIHAASADGRPSRSRFVVLERRGVEAFLADVFIETGRPHQIRIHAAAEGHPLVGDPLYEIGGRPHPESTALPGDPGYRLHAAELRFDHPQTGEQIALRCDPPADLKRSVER